MRLERIVVGESRGSRRLITFLHQGLLVYMSCVVSNISLLSANWSLKQVCLRQS